MNQSLRYTLRHGTHESTSALGMGYRAAPNPLLILTCCVVLLSISSTVPVSARQATDGGGVALIQESEDQTTCRIVSPYDDLSRTVNLLSTISIELVLQMGYEESTREGPWKTGTIEGLSNHRFFEKRLEAGEPVTLELAVAQNPAVGYDIFLFGESRRGTGAFPNPELVEVRDLIESLVLQLEEEKPLWVLQEDLAYHMYTLSYTDGDRAIAVLKALGYYTIEYAEDKESGSTDERIYNPVFTDSLQLPYVVKIIEAPKTSLLDPPPGVTYQEQIEALKEQQESMALLSVPDIGGTYLHQMTSGEPPQRLLIVYHRTYPQQAENILRLLREAIDLPARQVVIEALVVELNEESARDLGITFAGALDRLDVSLTENTETGFLNPFVFTFDRALSDVAYTFRASLKALIDEGQADVLSNPSVLVLDGRQARIQIGQQIPITKQAVTQVGSFGSVEYLPVGIVLNLRPRISENGAEITMQVETIISSIVQFTGQLDVAQAPVIDNRRVQSFVRVFDKTPFIIGGLISTESIEREVGVPLLASLPILGNLFKQTIVSSEKREVIVVLTPHVVPIQEHSFSHVIPKDAEIFDSFDKILFRNTYRVRRDDVYDLSFVTDALENLRQGILEKAESNPDVLNDEAFSSVLEGRVPGEEILVRRMLYEIIVDQLQYEQLIDLGSIIYLTRREEDDGLEVENLSALVQNLGEDYNALTMLFEKQIQANSYGIHPPVPRISYERLDSTSDHRRRLMELNPDSGQNDQGQSAIMITTLVRDPLRRLKGVLVLKRLLDVNETLPLTLESFQPGRQIVFPDRQDLTGRFHIIDADAAQYFYDVFNYYGVFLRRYQNLVDQLEKY